MNWFYSSVNRASLTAIINGSIISTLAHCSGFLIFITYGAYIFEEAATTHIDPYVSSIVLAILQLVGILCTTKFSDSLGRKALQIISLLGSAFGQLSFALYSYLRHIGYELTAFEWVPVVSLSFVIFIASAGVVPLIFVSSVESLPAKVLLASFFSISFRFNLLTAQLVLIITFSLRFERLAWPLAMYSWIVHRFFYWNYFQSEWQLSVFTAVCWHWLYYVYLDRCTSFSWSKRQKGYRWMQLVQKIIKIHLKLLVECNFQIKVERMMPEIQF